MLKQSYDEYRSKNFILGKTARNKKFTYEKGSYIDRVNQPYSAKATGYYGIIPKEIIIVDNDCYESENEFEKFVKDLGYTPEPFAITPSGGEHYAFENPYPEMVVGLPEGAYKKVDIFAGFQSLIPIVGTTVINKHGEKGVYQWHEDNYAEEIIINKAQNPKELFMLKDRVEPTGAFDIEDDLDHFALFSERNTEMPDEEVDSLLSKVHEDLPYDIWLKVGMALYDRYLGADEGKVKWHEFSKRSAKKYDEDFTEKKWVNGNLKGTTITFKTLRSLSHEGKLTDINSEIKHAKSDKDLKKITKKLSKTKSLNTTSKLDQDVRADLAEKINAKYKALKADGVVTKVEQARTILKAIGYERAVEDKLKEQGLDFPDMSFSATQKRYRPIETLTNLEYFVEYHSELDFKFDVILKRVIINNNYRTVTGINSQSYSKLHDELVRLGINGASMLTKHFDAMCFSRQENGLIKHIENLGGWDGVDYISKIAHTLKTKNASKKYVETVIKCFVIQAISAWDGRERTPHKLSKLDSVLVFVGGQGIGKTTWVGRLMPDFMHHYFKDGLELNPSNKDSLMEALNAGLVELGELDATQKKADISSLKAFLSRTTDEYRSPYAKVAERFDRQTVFVGTVNTPDFLKDATGSRRFLTLEVEDLSLPSKDDVKGMWKQALALYLQGENWLLPLEFISERNKINIGFTDIGVAGDLAEQFIKAIKNSTGKNRRFSVTKILSEITGGSRFDKRDRSDFISSLNTLGYSRNNEGKYYLPEDVFSTYLNVKDDFDDLDNLDGEDF